MDGIRPDMSGGTADGGHDILCVGSVLWDTIGRTEAVIGLGSDVPGRIVRQPGGVALNVARAAQGCGMRPALLSVVGRDPEGDELVRVLDETGLATGRLLRTDELPTDRYMAIESGTGEVVAIADANSFERAGADILEALRRAPFDGPIVIDGNFTAATLGALADDASLADADLRFVSASPGKAERLAAVLRHPSATLYVNRQEAEILCRTVFDGAAGAAERLAQFGPRRVVVTDGPRAAAAVTADGTWTVSPADDPPATNHGRGRCVPRRPYRRAGRGRIRGRGPGTVRRRGDPARVGRRSGLIDAGGPTGRHIMLSSRAMAPMPK